MDFLPKIKIEIVLADAQAGPAVEAIVKAAKTGKIGDGKIFVSRWKGPCASAREKQASRRFESDSGENERKLDFIGRKAHVNNS